MTRLKHGSYVGGGMAYARGSARRPGILQQAENLAAQVERKDTGESARRRKRRQQKQARKRNR